MEQKKEKNSKRQKQKNNADSVAGFALNIWKKTEVQSSRTSLASRTDFKVLGLGLEGQVLGLGLEASSPRNLLGPRLEDSSIF